jgi:lysophospholipase L1-like esterase
LAAEKNINDVKAEYRKLISAIQTNSPQTQIFIHSLSPVSRVSWQNQLPQNLTDDIIEANKFLPRLAEGKKIVFVDIYPQFADGNENFNTQYTINGVHPNGKDYIKWREILQPYLIQNKP